MIWEDTEILKITLILLDKARPIINFGYFFCDDQHLSIMML